MKRPYLFSLLLFVMTSIRMYAAPVIDSIVATTSSCQDNGVIMVYAHGSGTLAYAVISGPQTHAQQTSRTFRAMPAGSYIIAVSDATGQHTTRSAVVGGNYSFFDFAPYAIYPKCLKDSGVTLICHPDSLNGLHPFTWQLMQGSPMPAAPQSSDTFYITAAGTYEIRCTDACGNIRSRLFTVDRTFSSTIQLGYSYTTFVLHCDSLSLGEQIFINGGENNLPFPLTFTEYDIHGDTISYTFPDQVFDTLLPMGDGSMQIYDRYINLYNRFGLRHSTDVIYTLFSDGCGDTVANSFVAAPYTLTLDSWAAQNTGNCQLGSFPVFRYNLAYPSKWIMIDNATNTIVDSSNTGFALKAQPPNRNYTFICFDECGDTLRQSFLWQQAQTFIPAAFPSINQNTCIDSTASVNMNISGFKSTPIVRILTGPSTAHSTKPGYAYSTHLTYPITGQFYYRELSGFPAGHYTYEVSDTCGGAVSGSFDITPDQLSSFSHKLTASMQCPGGNSISYQYSNNISTDNTIIYYVVKNLSTGQILDSAYAQGYNGSAVINNLNPGTFELKLVIQSYYAQVTDSAFCTTVYDTVVIPPYQYPSMLPMTVSGCSGAQTITALMDSTKGVAPFYYQIINGPQFSPEQMGDGHFYITQPGVYSIVAIDQCGNGMVRNINVDSAAPAPVTLVVTDSCFRASVRGNVYTESTTLADTSRSVLGCDSVIRIDSIIIRGQRIHAAIIAEQADTFCSAEGGVITARSDYSSYSWNTGDTSAMMMVYDSGWYYLTVIDTEQCTYYASVHVALTDTPKVASGWVEVDSVCIDDPLELHLTLSTDDANYHWSDMSNAGLDRAFEDSGTFIFTVANRCASSVYILQIIGKKCDEYIYTPNAFSPNGDGVNDVFRVYSSYEFSGFELKIFDRWGEKIYEGHDLKQGWDGRYKNADQPTGVYVFEYTATWPSGHSKKSKGSLTMIR